MISLGSFSISKEMFNLLTLLAVALAVHQIAIRVFIPLFTRMIQKTRIVWDNILLKRHVIRRMFHLLPATVLSVGLPFVLENRESGLYAALLKVIMLYYTITGLLIYIALLDTVQDLFELSELSKKFSLCGVLQALKIVGFLSAIVLVISQLAGKSPVYYLSGLGAFTAILLLVFKDSILGLVAGVQLSSMDLVRKGDWIEMPKHGADGDVIDISLTTVRIQNWDKTISSIPAYDLVSSSFKNWRGMSDSGGRRIKRSINIDLNTIGFLNIDDIERLKKIKLLHSYLDEKLRDIEDSNTKQYNPDELQFSGNGRRLTNVGTFRAYCAAYLKNKPQIHQKLTFLIRQLAPGEHGLPIEIYVFTNITGWAVYEDIQSDIFDHLLAILPEFNLRAYQALSGLDIARAAGVFTQRQDVLNRIVER